MRFVSVDKDSRYLPADSAEPQLADKDVIVRYLTGAPTVAAVRTFAFDEIEPERDHSISLIYSSDGEWVWSAVTAYYVEEYDVRLPEDFVQWILAAKTPPTALADDIRRAAMVLATSEDALLS